MILSLVVFALTVIVASGQENEESPQPGASSPQLSPQPQIYFKDNTQQPGKLYDVGHSGHTSTTVCVELRNGPANPYTVCGPQVQTGIQPYLYPGLKDTIKPIQIQNQPQLSSEQQPVVVSTNGRLYQAPQASQIPVLVQPMAPTITQLYRSQALRQSPSSLYQKPYSSPLQHNSMSTDGALSMNCRVGGIKLSNQDISSLYNSAGYQLSQPAISQSHQNSYKAQSAQYDRYPSWLYDPNSAYNNYLDPSMYSFDMMGRDATGSNEMMHGQLSSDIPPEPAIDTSKIVEENRRKLNELKKQIASLQDITTDVHNQRASQSGETPQSAPQNQSQPIPTSQQSPPQQSSQSSGEQKQNNKNPNQQSQSPNRPHQRRQQ